MSRINQKKNVNIFSVSMLILCVAGLLINLIFSKIVVACGFPLYIDNVGSILVAILGGTLPGITVGFLSNILGSMSNPITMYYSVFTIIIAWLASVYSQKGFLKTWKGWLLAVISFVLAGGACGSIMTWFLYGQTISGVAEPYAQILSAHGISPFFAQWVTDIIIDIPDKVITAALSWLLLQACIKAFPGRFPYGFLYEPEAGDACEIAGQTSMPSQTRHHHDGRTSVQKRITAIVTISISIVGSFSLFMGAFYYQKQMNDECRYIAQMVSAQAAACIDGDAVQKQFQEGRQADGYQETEDKLLAVFENAPDLIRFVYVYRVTEDGIFVVYDLDTEEMKASEVGERITTDMDISSRMEEFLAGGAVEPGNQNSRYGTQVSAYTPVCDSEGRTVAYACADVDASIYTNGMLTYIARNAALLFAVILLATYITVWFVNYHVTEPIRSIVQHSKRLSRIEPEKWLDSDVWKEKEPICTGDEIEDLYTAITETEEYASINVRRRIETEQELIQTKALEEANRDLEMMIQKADEANRAKTEFFSRMSHDMRTPMNGILGLAELSEDESDVFALKSNIKKIKQSGQYLLGLINDTLDFQKIESGKLILEPKIVSTRELVNNVFLMIKLEADKKNITLKMNATHADLDCYVKVDPMRMKQIFFNLLSNAVKFTQPGGCIDIGFLCTGHTGNVAHDIITITDTGIGMSREFLEQHIFQPFSQESSDVVTNYAGSGLGLSIVKKLVELMNGSIEVESEIGEGTTFTVRIDFERADEPEMKRDSQQTEIQQSEFRQKLKGRHILLAEDHPLNAEIAMRLLDKAGCSVDWVKDGQECFDRFETALENQYDLILMDIRMPRVDGIAAARMIRDISTRKDAKRIPIIAMTANAYETDIQNCKNAGMNAHISKPVDVEKMYRVIASFLE